MPVAEFKIGYNVHTPVVVTPLDPIEMLLAEVLPIVFPEMVNTPEAPEVVIPLQVYPSAAAPPVVIV